MSDAPAGKFAPKCAKPGCGAWASWGYGCTSEIGSGTWFCFAHRPSDEAKAVEIGAATRESIDDVSRQQRLL